VGALGLTLVLVVLTTSLFGFTVNPGAAHAPSIRAPSASLAGSGGAAKARLSTDGGVASASAQPSVGSSFNPRCFGITKSTCVRVCTSSTPDIIPTGVNHTSNVQPLYSQNIYLCVYSERNLIWATTGVPTDGPHAPVTLNVTGVLWNGDPYTCSCQGLNSVYHSDSNTWYTVDNGLSGTNATYPYVYDVTVWNRSNGSSGVQNFFPGETVSWWIQIVNYTNISGYTENRSVTLSYRVAGAWAFSPHIGAGQYAGPNASTGDLRVSHSPLAPNWNDTVNVSVSVTPEDVTNRTAIGMATLVIELYQGSSRVGNETQRGFPIGSFLNSTGILIKGNDTANTTIPSSFTQVAGDTIVFWIVAQDNAAGQNDTIILPAQSIPVNGNGSFSSGVFTDDVNVISHPAEVANPLVNVTTLQIIPAIIGPGENVSLTVQSRSPTTSLFSVLVVYTLTYAPLSEVASAVVSLSRINSTSFHGQIPGMPVDSTVNFTVLAFDYTHRLDESSIYSYSTPSLTNYVAVIPANDTFFYVYVYNNGSSSYVNGATVQVRGPTPAFNTVSITRFGIAYPNATGNNFIPLLLEANATYNVTVTAPIITSSAQRISVLVDGLNQMTIHGTLARGEGYYVVQEGDSIYFWLNGTVPSTVFSPPAGSAGGGVQLAAFLALIAAAVMAFVMYRWFNQIQKRRKAEERRVTL
jgi:hypothetical protein